MSKELDVALQEASVYLRGTLEKQAQNPLQGVMDGIPDTAKASIRNALLGGLLGAGGGAFAAGSEDRLRGALLGAGLGAATGGAGTLGAQLLSGRIKFPGEPGISDSLTGLAANVITDATVSSPGLVAGGLLGAGGAWWKGPRVSSILAKLNKEVVGTAGAQATPAAQANSAAAARAFTRAITARDAKMFKAFSGVTPASIFATLKSNLKSKPRYKPTKKSLGKALSALSSTVKTNRVIKALPKRFKHLAPSRLPWALLPIGLGVGYLTDKYLKGDY